MKLLFHEKILVAATLLFVGFVFIFNTVRAPTLNVVSGSMSPATPYLININIADIEELDTLEGIGEKTAEAIISYRNKNGAFKTVNELCEVSGIGASTLDKIKEYIKV